MGSIRWELAACLLFAWIIVYFALWKSVRSSGRVLYVTATVPFLLVLAFLGRSLTLDGAEVGLDFLFNPNWKLLADSKVIKCSLTTCILILVFEDVVYGLNRLHVDRLASFVKKYDFAHVSTVLLFLFPME